MTDNVIMVAGLHSGGTSLLAGLLHHLGVDMGKVMSAEDAAERAAKVPDVGGVQLRRYRVFECHRLGELMAEQGIRDGVVPGPMSTFTVVATYIQERLKAGGGPHGFKAPNLMFLGMGGACRHLPLTIVHVHRPFEQILESDAKYRGTSLTRAGFLGTLCAAKRMLLAQIPPVVTVEFDEFFESPEEVCHRLVDGLGLEPSDEQVGEALGFINRPAASAGV